MKFRKEGIGISALKFFFSEFPHIMRPLLLQFQCGFFKIQARGKIDFPIEFIHVPLLRKVMPVKILTIEHKTPGADCSPRATRSADLLAAAMLVLLVALTFLPATLLRGVFYFHDVQYYFYPYHRVSADLLSAGCAPLWNPYAFSGLPLLGDGQTAIFFPSSWLFLVLQGGAALNYAILMQFVIAGLSMYLWARSLELDPLPAFVAATAFMLGGFMVTHALHLSIIGGVALLPLIFACVERSLRTDRLAWFVATAGAIALQVFAGHPQIPVYTALALGLYVLVRASERAHADHDLRWLWRLPLRLVGIYLLGYTLAAIQLVPWIDLGRLSLRAAGTEFSFVFSGSMHGSEWLLFLFPYLYGSFAIGPYAAQPMGIALAMKTWEHSAYVGIVTLALAAIGLFELFVRTPTHDAGDVRAARHRRFTLAGLGLLLIVGMLMAAGKYTPLARLIYLTPVLGKLRVVERALVLAAFALATLAGFGLQRLIAWPRRRATILIAALLAVAPVLVLLWAVRLPLPPILGIMATDLANLRLARANGLIPLLLAFAGALLLVVWTLRPATWLKWAMTGLVLLDLVLFAAFFNPLAAPDLFERVPASVTFLRRDLELFRKATYIAGSNLLDNETARETLAVSWGMPFGVADINGFNSLQPRRYTDYLFSPAVGDVSYGYLWDEALFREESPILSALNVKYLLVPAWGTPQLGANWHRVYANHHVRIYENALVYPRAYFVESARIEHDSRLVLRTVTAPGFDGRREALVEADRLPDLVDPRHDRDARVQIVAYAPNRIVLETATAGVRLLVLSEMDLPGWRASIDGVAAPIFRTNYLYRGVIVPAGAHTIELRYRPRSVALGAAISLLALALAAGLVIADRRRRI
jgi:hypothetical protein